MRRFVRLRAPHGKLDWTDADDLREKLQRLFGFF